MAIVAPEEYGPTTASMRGQPPAEPSPRWSRASSMAARQPAESSQSAILMCTVVSGSRLSYQPSLRSVSISCALHTSAESGESGNNVVTEARATLGSQAEVFGTLAAGGALPGGVDREETEHVEVVPSAAIDEQCEQHADHEHRHRSTTAARRRGARR